MNLPRHIAVIMDGNGRWARKRLLPRVAGHQQGLESVRAIVSACVKKKIPYLTLYAFSSENWQRPKSEVTFLLNLFLKSLKTEIKSLHERGELDVPEQKKCFRCKKIKHRSEFYRDRSKVDGLMTYCSKCAGELVKERRKKRGFKA